MLQIPVRIVSTAGQLLKEKVLSYASNERLLSDLTPSELADAKAQALAAYKDAEFQAVKMIAKMGLAPKGCFFERGTLRVWAS